MSDKPLNDLELEAFFKAERDTVFEPSPDLLARVLSDAEAIQAAPAMAPEPARGGFFKEIFSGIGGWPSLAGLATATVAGLWIGISPPAALEDLTFYLSDDSESYLLNLAPDVGADLLEG